MSGEMPERRMQEEVAVDVAVRRLLDAAVEDALVAVQKEGGPDVVTRGVADLLKEALITALEGHRETMAMAAGNGGFGVGGEATASAMGAVKAVKDLGFVEFTAGLINGTFDAVTGSTIKQMDAYAKMVADIAKSLKEFQAENVSDAQIDAYLLQRYPNPADPETTMIVPGRKFVGIEEDEAKGVPGKSAADQALEVANAIVLDSQKLKPLATPLTVEEIYPVGADSIRGPQVMAIRTASGLLLAKGSQDVLVEMARMGMARIVVTNGEILSKLTFRVSASEIDQRVQHNYEQESSHSYLRGNLSLPLKFLGFSGGGGTGSNKFTCTTVNESSFDSTTMSAEIIGQVRINFKTESFAPAEAPQRVL